MKLLRKLCGKLVNGKKVANPALTEHMLAELIKDPAVVSSKMVRKIVLNGLIRLEKEGSDPFDDNQQQTK